MTDSNQIEPRLKSAKVDASYITLTLEDGRILLAPISWFPRLAYAREEDRQDFELLGGRGVAWFRLGEDLTVEQILKGQGSYESEASFKKWQKKYTQGLVVRPFPFLPLDAFDEVA